MCARRSVWFGLFDLACSVQRVWYNGTFHNKSLAFFSALKVGALHTLGQLLLCVCVYSTEVCSVITVIA